MSKKQVIYGEHKGFLITFLGMIENPEKEVV